MRCAVPDEPLVGHITSCVEPCHSRSSRVPGLILIREACADTGSPWGLLKRRFDAVGDLPGLPLRVRPRIARVGLQFGQRTDDYLQVVKASTRCHRARLSSSISLIRFSPKSSKIIRTVETSHLPVRRTLVKIGIPKTTFYAWLHRYAAGGFEALDRIPDEIRDKVIERALDEPDEEIKRRTIEQ